ncbi:hypothetical protein MUY27_04570 [Mucilaginibacter sp. RS28]|uniref:Uncharacterized protein n=1 Tax=Mucilaginibacter straminoryzae TaxID=2932774 RepID=A0A9X1X1N3_9SPHI|nr:hypothetical protein [Mucilaginibacter straminoryzae]MCJ8208971.1 hypothetical protein [Mucilaginibacter straminoryzae]
MEREPYEVLHDDYNTSVDVILSTVTGIRIKVCPLEKVSFKPDPKELQLYVKNNGQTIAFETIDFSVRKGFDVYTAVKWYTRQKLNNHQTQIMV